MTVGQRIQEHRKKNGLSQEELGQRLLVSRQTVSLWEKDQTLPTVDNLLLLKEIFGISVDELLGADEKKEEAGETNPPLESWEITYRREPLAEMSRRYIWLRLVLGIALVLLGLSLLLDRYLFVTDRVFGAALLLISALLFWNLGSVLKRKKKRVRLLPGNRLTLALYEEEMYAVFFRGGKKEWEGRILYGELERVQKDGAFYLMYHSGREYLIPVSLFEKGEYDPETRLEALLKKLEDQSKRKKPKGLLRAVSLVLCGLTYLTYFVLEGASVFLLAADDPHAALAWTMIPATVIPAGSLIIGICLLCKNKKGLHNVIVGAVVLCAALRFCAVMPGTIKWHERQRAAAEEELVDLGVELPPIESIVQTYEGGGFVDGVAHFSTQNVQFKVKESIEFELGLPGDPAWMTELPAELLPISVGTMEFDYLSIYNITTGEFNTLPAESGTYQFLRVAYRAGGGVLDQYAIEYTADP